MAVSTKSSAVLWNAVSVSAGGTVTLAEQSIATKISTTIVGNIVNSASSPTAIPYVALEVKETGGTWREVSRRYGNTSASNTTAFAFIGELNDCAFFRLVATGNTGNAVTVNAQVHHTDSIG